MVRGDLPSTLPFSFRLLRLEPRVGKELKQGAKIRGLQFILPKLSVDIIPEHDPKFSSLYLAFRFCT